MDCGRFGELIGEYLDQGLTSRQRHDFSHHLLACLPCRQLFDEIRENVLLCREMAPGHRGHRATAWAAPLERPVVEHLPPRSPVAEPAGESVDVAKAGETRETVPSIGDLLSCRTLDLLISDFFDGGEAASPSHPDYTAIDRHLAACDNCRVLFTGLREAMVSEPEAHRLHDPQADARTDHESDLELRILARTVGASR